MINKPLEFCTHLARAIRANVKTTTWKPLSPADQERRAAGYTSPNVPFPAGSVSPLMEPWGYVNGKITFASSFAPDTATGPSTPPPGWRPMRGTRWEKSLLISSCDLVQLSTITEEKARLTGTNPPEGSTYLAEFERQWRAAYRGAQAWDSDPYCWLIAFTLAV